MHPLVACARELRFIRETEGPNKGRWVGMLQRFTYNKPGDSWCASFESYIEYVAYHGVVMTPRTASCQEKLDYCVKQGWIVDTPQPGDLYFFLNSEGHAHHIGIVTRAVPHLVGIAGNTSMDGKSVNGDGVHEHQIWGQSMTFARLPEPK